MSRISTPACKRSLMGLAGLMVLIFHFYIPLSGSAFETAVYKSLYIGVDLFFLLSGCSLGSGKEFNYGSFIKNRITSIYIPFVIFAIIAALYKSWTIGRFFTVISGVEFFRRGGGSFLWFAIGIFILYLLAPLFLWIKRRLGLWGLAVMLAVWFATALFLQFVLQYTSFFIMLNRLPVFFVGLYYRELFSCKTKKATVIRFILSVLIFIIGAFLVYKFAAIKKLNRPVTDIYYVVALPLTVSLTLICDSLSEKLRFSNIPLRFLGGFTFELYGLQMIFGYDIEKYLLKLTSKNPYISFVGTLLALIIGAYLFRLIYKLPGRLIKKRKSINNN